jgi:tRNA A-37 threonylcarbamoyl transferase component Bud32
MATDDQTPVNPEQPPMGEPPKHTRIPVSRDPTTPIRLTGGGRLPSPLKVNQANIKTPTPGPVPKPAPAPADDDNGSWIGSEHTMVGGSGTAKSPSDRLPVVITDDDHWLGSEQTAIPASRAPAAPEDENWGGNEMTLVGAPVSPSVKPMAGDSDEGWLGRDATVIGDAPGGAAGGGKKGDTTARGGIRKTTATMDDGWHLKGRQGPLTGKTVGDYEVGGILGEGGMGTVYRAKQVSLKRRVALKVLPPNLTSNPSMRQRFEQEARTASLLNSPNVVQVFAAGNHEDMVYFVMEFVEGTDLAEKIREKQDAGEQFTPDEATNYVIQAARGLAEAGKHNIVHRDIKPANLMITAKGLVKIADFGISKIAGEHGLTMTGTAVGTPAYCSPEQGRGDQVDVRADIYSLGIVFYELLTGKKPFDGTTANALIYQHNYAEPTLVTALRAEVPDAYQAVVLKCMQKDPAKRYQDAAELVSDLERVRAGSAPMTALMNAFGTGADEAMKRLGIKQRRIWPYLVAALVLVACVATGVVWQTSRTAAQKTLLDEIGRLRTDLVVLDKPMPVTKGSRTNLTRLAELVAVDDRDVVRWNAKLGRVEQVQKRLARLDAVELPPAALRTEATLDLDRYREDVGGTGEDVTRWQAKIDAARDEIEILRTSLAELDGAQVVSTAMAERLAPQLAQLAVLAGDGDEDAKRWAQKLAGGRDRAGQLRAALAVLDDAKTVLTEVRIAQSGQDLAALRAIVGDQDPAIAAWAAKLKVGQDDLARLRKNLARLDAVELATVGLQAALKADLGAYTALVEANDPELKRWARKMADSSERIANLRKALSRLDRPESLNVVEQKTAEEQLTAYRALVSPDDGQLQAWAARMTAERDSLAALGDTLKRLANPERMRVVELEAVAKALETLGKLGAIADADRRLGEQRIAGERQQLADLRAALRAAGNGVETTIDQDLVERLNLLARLTGEDDEDVKRWRGRVNEYERLRAQLVVLDGAAPLPDAAKESLEAYALIVGKSAAEVRRWREKLERVAELQARLAPLDQVAPLPDHAAEDTQALLAEVSDKDSQARRWRLKTLRVIELVTTLERILAGVMILPPEAPALGAELASLVGTRDPRVARLVARVVILVGPPRPVWATGAGRDEFGPWADLTIKGVTQRFRFIPSGAFVLGSSDAEPGRAKDETAVRVTLSRSFWLAETECPQGFWEVVAFEHDSRFRDRERPVERVSWDDCKQFCVRLSGIAKGLNARLPTEAEWEYACRAGATARWSDSRGEVKPEKLDTIAWFAGNAVATQGVKRRLGNALGLFDMHGNVWEWCEDRYGTYSPTAVTDPLGREQETRVARGGSWGDSPEKLRAANRLAVRADMRTLYLGVRIAATVVWADNQEPGSAALGGVQATLVPVPVAQVAPIPTPVAAPVTQPVAKPAAPAPAAPAAPVAPPAPGKSPFSTPIPAALRNPIPK